MALVDRIREPARLLHVGRRGLEPDDVGVRRVGERPRDRRLEPVADAVEALGRPLAGEELGIGRVDVGREELRAQRVGARDDHGRHAHHVGREPGADQRAHELRGRDEHLAAEVAALLLRRELVLEVHARGARLDHRLHQLEGVQRASEAGLCVGDDRRQPVDAPVALRPGDLVGAHERVVQPAHERRCAVRRVEALVRVRLAAQVSVGRDLPAGEVDRLQSRLDHLHRLAAGQRAERGDVVLGREQPPEALGPEPGERVLDGHRAAEPDDGLGRVRAPNPLPALVGVPVGGEAFGLLLDPSFGINRRRIHKNTLLRVQDCLNSDPRWDLGRRQTPNHGVFGSGGAGQSSPWRRLRGARKSAARSHTSGELRIPRCAVPSTASN